MFGFDCGRKSEMIFYITVKNTVVVVIFPFKLAEDFFVGLAENMSKRVESSAVRHAHHKLFHPEYCAVLNDIIERNYKTFVAFYTESFLAHELSLQELLKGCCLIEFLEYLLLLRGVKACAILQLDLVANPCNTLRLPNIIVFNANVPTVCFLQMVDDDAEFGLSDADFFARLKHFIEVGRSKAEVLNVECWRVFAAFTHRIGKREEVPA